MQAIIKFRRSILALDRFARFSAENPLRVEHSGCGAKILHNAASDVSNFKEHVSVCKSVTLRAGSPAVSCQVPCPGFNFEELCGKVYRSLPCHERQQVTSEAKIAGLVWLDASEKKALVSNSCFKTSPSHQGPAQPCENCSKAVALSNVKETFRSATSNPRYEFFNPFRSTDATTTGIREDQRAAYVSGSHP